MLTTIQNIANIHLFRFIYIVYILYIFTDIDLYSMRILKSLIGKLFLFDSHMYVLVQDNNDKFTHTHTHALSLSLSLSHTHIHSLSLFRTLLSWGLFSGSTSKIRYSCCVVSGGFGYNYNKNVA